MNLLALLKKSYLFEKFIIGYSLLMMILILAIGRPLSDYFDELIFYFVATLITFLVINFVEPEKNKITRAVRYLYPIFLFSFFYWNTGGLMHLLFDSFYDWQLTAFEKSIFGVNPTLYIDKHLLNVWLNEIISMGYFSYYFMIPWFALYTYFKKEYDILINFSASAALTFFLSYMLFFLYPIEGPRWHFALEYVNIIEGPVFRQLVNMVIDNGAVRGGCMPSSHFGIALVILIYCMRYFRKVGWVLLPLVITLGIGTFWGRFHYISDVFVGGFIGLAAVLIVWKVDKPPKKRFIDQRN